jgi:acetyl-CoA carboxylase biotin carboxyl carrier protein
MSVPCDQAKLEQIRAAVIDLLGALPSPPSRMRLRAGDIDLDLGWEAPAGAPAATLSPVRIAEAVVVEAQAALAGAPEPALVSPSVGVFYHASSPGTEPFLTVGAAVEIGQQIGIVEAMKLMIPIYAERAGIVTAVLAADGSPVEYAQPLFSLAEWE